MKGKVFASILKHSSNHQPTPKPISMKSILAIIFAAALFQSCNGLGMDSNDPGTARGNDTITTQDRYAPLKPDGANTSGEGNVNSSPTGTSADTIGAGNPSDIDKY
jgi:hypothetical protein